MSNIKTYSELIKFHLFDERLKYLQLHGLVGKDTFGFDRYLNQIFYRSEEWRIIRNMVIVRDNGCDLGILDKEIKGSRILIHHLNPITKDDIVNKTEFLLNPEYLITTCKKTHDIIHYGYEYNEENKIVERYKYDTCPWKIRR